MGGGGPGPCGPQSRSGSLFRRSRYSAISLFCNLAILRDCRQPRRQPRRRPLEPAHGSTHGRDQDLHQQWVRARGRFRFCLSAPFRQASFEYYVCWLPPPLRLRVSAPESRTSSHSSHLHAALAAPVWHCVALAVPRTCNYADCTSSTLPRRRVQSVHPVRRCHDNRLE